MTAANLPILASALLLAAAAWLLTMRTLQNRFAGLIGEGCAFLSCLVACFAMLQLSLVGPRTFELVTGHGFGFSVRLDVVSATMLLLTTFVGWIVVRFSRTYLDGEPGQTRFIGWLCATLTAVTMLVLSGNVVQLGVAWIATSLCLHKLLLFYPERPAARRAARKKFVVARIGDVILVAALTILATGYGTGDIATILANARSGTMPAMAPWAAGLLVAAALLKSAQFPSHGWLVEVMETPTPVSALLHAGVINAGGFLLIRFADVLLSSPGALATLVMVGGFTALFGSLVMLTQPAVKTSLAWSTVAQMGFMTMQCGLALFPLALLHIVAHSLYKAHSFLSSGGAVARIAAIPRPGPVAVPSLRSVSQAFAIALAIYLLLSVIFGLTGKSPQAIAVGAILIFGVAYLIAQGLADAAPRALTLRTCAAALIASISYFLLQSGASWLTKTTLPATPTPSALEWVMIVLALASFGLVAFAQALFPHWAGHPAAAGLRVHLSNGFYANALFDRVTAGWAARKSA